MVIVVIRVIREINKIVPALNFFAVIVFVRSQYDGTNIEQRTKSYGWRQNQEANLKNSCKCAVLS